MNNQRKTHIRRKQAFLSKAGVANYKVQKLKQFRLSQNIQRPTRNITKPKRYVTTSSQDEAPSLKKKKKPETEKPINLDKDVDEIRNAPNDASTTILPSQESERSNMSSWSLPIRDDVAVTNEKVAVDRSYTQLMSGTSTSVTRVGGQLESTNRASTFTEDQSVRPNDSGALNPLLHLQSLQQMPQTSGCTGGYSETIMGNYRYQRHDRYDGYDYPYPSRDNYHKTTQHEHATQHDHQHYWNAIIGEFNNMRKQLENMPTKEDFITITQKLDKLLKKQSNKMPMKPHCIPLKSVKEVQNFDNIDEEQYNEVVTYLKYLGGQTLDESVKFCMKQIITDEALNKYSLWGEKDRNLELYNTQLLYAVYEAVANSPYFAVPDQQKFYDAVKESIRFAKQRLRNSVRRQPGEKGRRTRRREEADAIFGTRNREEEEEISNREEEEEEG
ncbi:uncharacterized protein [Linepithema humile]|uniref:uncharacterized protein isoform X2 n=2 Tax=Linepithema humile TaxID=83485 RepID=UPI00351E2F5F